MRNKQKRRNLIFSDIRNILCSLQGLKTVPVQEWITPPFSFRICRRFCIQRANKTASHSPSPSAQSPLRKQTKHTEYALRSTLSAAEYCLLGSCTKRGHEQQQGYERQSSSAGWLFFSNDFSKVNEITSSGIIHCRRSFFNRSQDDRILLCD